MTCKEKYKLDHPDWNGIVHGIGCPFEYGYLEIERDDNDNCIRRDCVSCWNRDIPEEIVDKLADCGEVYAVSAEELRSVIKDSGDRTEFSTGAVRDMHEGKGRCDLMPLDVVARILADNVLVPIHSFQESGQVDYLYDVLRFHTIFEDPYTMFLEVAKHFEDGAKKYGESNWRRGIPVNCYIDSAVRHYLKYLRGDTDERHDRAFVWNILCCIWTVENKPELNNYKKEVN